MSESRTFRCPGSARWLPRTLAAAALVGGMLLSTRIYVGVAGSGWSHSRTLVMFVGAVLALLIVRSGASVRREFDVLPEALAIRAGRQRRELPYAQIVSLGYETPFVTRLEWLPALILVDRFGKRWRVPALIEDGVAFIDELIRVSGRDDLETQAEAYGLRKRMKRSHRRIVWGYGISAGIVLVCLWISITGPSA